jgi:hypothetical protein
MIVIHVTGPTALVRGLMLFIYYNFKKIVSALSKPSGVACNVLTHSYTQSSVITLSNTCGELYSVQFSTPPLTLLHTTVLQTLYTAF